MAVPKEKKAACRLRWEADPTYTQAMVADWRMNNLRLRGVKSELNLNLTEKLSPEVKKAAEEWLSRNQPHKRGINSSRRW